MRRLILALCVIALYTQTGHAQSIASSQSQQSDPTQDLAKEWLTLKAADTVALAAHDHVAELAKKLVESYQQQRQQLDRLRAAAADLDVYLKACGDKPGCTQPVE